MSSATMRRRMLSIGFAKAHATIVAVKIASTSVTSRSVKNTGCPPKSPNALLNGAATAASGEGPTGRNVFEQFVMHGGHR